MSGLLGPVTANPLMMAQALKAREQPRKQLTGQGLLDTAAIGLSPVPVIGDALGLAADASRFYNEPESRTPLNFGLAALGAIPFIPPLVSMGLGKFAQSQGKTLSAPSMSGPAKNQAGAIVYHGSPHKFDAFDSSKIGTGEGAQAYGHGLYFAENPAVAGAYKTELSKGRPPEYTYKYGGKEVVKDSPEYQAASIAQMMQEYAKDIKGDEMGWLNREIGARGLDSKTKKEVLRLLKEPIELVKTNTGSLYKVDLPDEAIAKMLDYDAPLSKQPDAVKNALRKFNKGIDSDNTLARDYLKVSGGVDKNVASELSGAGILGIRYLDGGSRSAGSGTSNFVVFPGNEGLLKILERQ